MLSLDPAATAAVAAATEAAAVTDADEEAEKKQTGSTVQHLVGDYFSGFEMDLPEPPQNTYWDSGRAPGEYELVAGRAPWLRAPSNSSSDSSVLSSADSRSTYFLTPSETAESAEAAGVDAILERAREELSTV